MTTLVTVEDVRQRVQSGLADADLQDIIEDEEAELIRRHGAHGDGSTSVAETPQPVGCELFLSRPLVSVSSISEAQILGGTTSILLSTAYYVWAKQGRISRLPQGTAWGPQVSVTFVPADDRARRKRVIIELVRLALEQTAMQAESVAGEYSYTAPDWEQKRNQLYKKLQFTEV